MFVKALEKAAKFTRPLILVKVFYSGRVEVICGTFIVVNPDGWALTAMHMLSFANDANAHEAEIAAYEAKLAEVEGNYSLNSKQRSQRLKELKNHPDWITDYTSVWGKEGVEIEENVYGDAYQDMALVKLTNFDATDCEEYPVFRNPSDDLVPGTSLCRLGYPFPNFEATFDPSKKEIVFSNRTQIHPFPNDGILTRLVKMVNEKDKKEATFIETSTPGLMGQSGGPVIDIAGNVCGLQSRTVNLPLGFSPSVERDGKTLVEHQFLNVGHAVHVQELIKLLKAVNVSFQTTG